MSTSVERVVFSFSLYGDSPKYTHGTLANAEIIGKRFPDALMFIYTADSVPTDIQDKLRSLPHVRIIPVPSREGSLGMFDRFLAIDSSDCDVMFVRDADSRVHDRDAACIEDFLADKTKLMQIVRDHKYHQNRISGGIFGLRKSALIKPMTTFIAESKFYKPAYGSDLHFLESTFYRQPLLSQTQIYDRFDRFEPMSFHRPFRVPITNNLFIGQVHLFREDGTEYTEFEA
jgi:hypothetical protein